MAYLNAAYAPDAPQRPAVPGRAAPPSIAAFGRRGSHG
jgi:hypothetical protein